MASMPPEAAGWLARAAADAQFAWLCRGLSLRLSVAVDGVRDGLLLCAEPRRLEAGELASPDIALSAPLSAWNEVFRAAPRPGYQSFGAWLRHDTGIAVRAEPVVQAQALAALERLVELARPAAELAAPETARDEAAIAGRRRMAGNGRAECLLHWLQAGDGVPLLFLHTAGADSRQYLHQLADVELQRGYRMFAFDMPWHGQSGGVGGAEAPGPYRLTAEDYRQWCVTFIEDIVGEAVILAGCSMGAAMALTVTADRPDLVRGCIALEAPMRAPGRRSELLADARIANGWHNPAYVRALLSPTAPQRFRDQACAIYAQARPGIYMGDLAYYSDEYDGAAIAGALKAGGRPIALLTGSYDYSASPDNTRDLVAAIDGDNVRFTEMRGLGHFPMIEDPDGFRPHLMAALHHMAAAKP